MNISLTPELEKFVHDKIESGLYISISDVIRESLRLMRTYEGLNRAIEIGLSQVKAGKTISSKESYNRIKKKIKNIDAKNK